MIKLAEGWKDYEVIATGGGMKLERWKDVILLRPDPQVIWPEQFDLRKYKGLYAVYNRSREGGGEWQYFKDIPEPLIIGRNGLNFTLKLMGFKHTGLFPEHAANWDIMEGLIQGAGREVNVLNLFAYTGGATVACAKAGAKVTHVDAARAMVDRAGMNAKLSNVPEGNIRYIVDDCVKFVNREIKRGKRYDGIILDPPAYGRGPSGEVWRIEDNLFSLVKLATEVLSASPLFFLINSYTTGLQPSVIKNILDLNLKQYGGGSEAYELAMPTGEGIVLPCGASGIQIFRKK